MNSLFKYKWFCIDAVFLAIAVFFISEILMSKYIDLSTYTVNNFITIVIISGVLLSSLYFIAIKKIKRTKSILLGSLIEIISLIIITMLFFILKVIFPFNVLTIRADIGYGDGILLVLIERLFLIVSAISRILLIAIFKIYNKIKKRQGTVPCPDVEN